MRFESGFASLARSKYNFAFCISKADAFFFVAPLGTTYTRAVLLSTQGVQFLEIVKAGMVDISKHSKRRVDWLRAIRFLLLGYLAERKTVSSESSIRSHKSCCIS